MVYRKAKRGLIRVWLSKHNTPSTKTTKRRGRDEEETGRHRRSESPTGCVRHEWLQEENENQPKAVVHFGSLVFLPQRSNKDGGAGGTDSSWLRVLLRSRSRKGENGRVRWDRPATQGVVGDNQGNRVGCGDLYPGNTLREDLGSSHMGGKGLLRTVHTFVMNY